MLSTSPGGREGASDAFDDIFASSAAASSARLRRLAHDIVPS
jgi:hypothetical protein